MQIFLLSLFLHFVTRETYKMKKGKDTENCYFYCVIVCYLYLKISLILLLILLKVKAHQEKIDQIFKNKEQ